MKPGTKSVTLHPKLGGAPAEALRYDVGVKGEQDELSPSETGTLTAYQLLRHAGTTVPDVLQLQVWEIEERHPWLKAKRGITLEYKTYIGPTGLTQPSGR